MGQNNALKIDLTKLPAGAADFLGREAELKLLDDAWADAGHTQVVELVAPGGVGKTALIKRWLDRLKLDGWRGAQRVYGWSFFSQGTSEDRQASDDNFLSAALGWFAVAHDPVLSPWDKGKRLAEAVAASRTLLVLDGVEPLQYPPGPMAGQLRAPGLKALLTQLVSGGQPGLCILTTRERLQDLAEYERSADHPTSAVVRHDLGNLSESDGARLLHNLGVRRAGAAAIASDDTELKQASREVHGHALTLSLLGSLLAAAYNCDIRQRDKVEFEEADAELRGGHAFKVMAAYETWFQREGEQGARELAALRLLGYFDRPADAGCLAALRQAPPIPGLTEPLVDLSAVQWNIIRKRLEQCVLIEPTQPDSPTIDTHPLVREYLAKALRERQPDAWREGHRRLYEHLKASVHYLPEGLESLEPLLQSVAHGCEAGLVQSAADVYWTRIQRGKTFYPIKQLGLIDADLACVRAFFDNGWEKLKNGLRAENAIAIFDMAAEGLHSSGRLPEAQNVMKAMYCFAKSQNQKKYGVSAAILLSEVSVSMGLIHDAIEYAYEAVALADTKNSRFCKKMSQVTLGCALHQSGNFIKAREAFMQAGKIQSESEHGDSVLLSLQGCEYC